MHILIVDDERPARGELLYMLQHLEGSATYHEAQNGEEALCLVADEPIDLVFLDINMPGMSGLAIAAAMLEKPNPPLIVFATAYDVHAVRAFELAALDYVVKPISEERLAQTIVRVRKSLIERESPPHAEEASSTRFIESSNTALRSYLESDVGQNELPKLWAERDNGNISLIDYSEILWCVAEDKKVYVQTASAERLLVRQTLKELEQRLQSHSVLRIHKAYLVNINFVDEIVPWFSGTYVARMKDADKTEIPMSRQYAKAFKERIR